MIDEQGHYVEKANFDVEITADILMSVSKISAIILFSGDSDFTYLIKIIHQKKKKMFIFSSRKTLAYELKLNADKYFLLENIPSLTKDKKFVKL